MEELSENLKSGKFNWRELDFLKIGNVWILYNQGSENGALMSVLLNFLVFTLRASTNENSTVPKPQQITQNNTKGER